MSKLVTGLYAAIGTPRSTRGQLDTSAARRWVAFLRRHGVMQVMVNGAAGEYCSTTAAELDAILDAVCAASGANGHVLCGIGAASLHQAIALGRLALQHRVRALLLPMPHFFPYEQDDLIAYVREAAAALGAPILLYNLPGFSTRLEPQTAISILDACPNIVGVKDSSSGGALLEALTAVMPRVPNACRLVGHDGTLAPALRGGLCDGVISGVAGVFPELYTLLAAGDREPAFDAAAKWVDEILEQIAPFPVPWGLKYFAEWRGIVPATFALPVSPRRAAQASELERWFVRRMPALDAFTLQNCAGGS